MVVALLATGGGLAAADEVWADEMAWVHHEAPWHGCEVAQAISPQDKSNIAILCELLPPRSLEWAQASDATLWLWVSAEVAQLLNANRLQAQLVVRDFMGRWRAITGVQEVRVHLGILGANSYGTGEGSARREPFLISDRRNVRKPIIFAIGVPSENGDRVVMGQ